MSSKNFVLNINPKMRSEKHRTSGFSAHTYWLIREIGNQMYFSQGKTEAKAWKSAKEKIQADFGKK